MKSEKRRFIIFSGVVAVLLVLFVFNSRSPRDSVSEFAVVALPVLGSEPVKLRVAHVTNPRFPALSQAQQAEVLAKAKILVQDNFNIEVEFSTPEELDIASFFALRKPGIAAVTQQTIVDPESLSASDRDQMRQGIYSILSGYKNESAQLADYARPYLTQPFLGDDLYQLSDALMETLLARLRYWREQTASDGEPVLNGSPYNEWVWWDSIGYGEMPYDVVLTNQLVASAETYAMDVHSCLRGGISAGTTSYSRSARLKAYSFVTSFPMLNDNPVLSELREDEHYSEAQISDYVAAILAHELGHLLLHLGHPFGSESCIMSPTPLLKFRSWYEKLDPARCPLASQPQMTPGAATIEYRPDW